MFVRIIQIQLSITPVFDAIGADQKTLVIHTVNGYHS